MAMIIACLLTGRGSVMSILSKRRVGWLVTFWAACACSSLLATGQRTRTIQYSPLVTLAERLLPDDEIVVVERSVEPSGMVDEPVSRHIEASFLVATSDAAVVFDTSSVDGFLTDGGLWVRTEIRGSVSEFVFDKRSTGAASVNAGSTANGQLLAHWIHGGETTIGKVTVRARPLGLRRNRRYLAFMVWDGRADFWYLGSAFEVTGNGTLRHLVSPGDPRKFSKSPFDQWTLRAATTAIKSAAMAQKVK